MTDVDKIARALRAAKRPMSGDDIVAATGVSKEALRWNIGRLRKRCHVVTKKVGGVTVFEITGDVELPKSAFAMPDDLWRGWVNPLNGLVPERLGL